MSGLSPSLILLVISLYFLFLIGISWVTSRNSDNATFFTANKSSPWLLVAIGMIGASLSGVTFISIPGVVGKDVGNNIDFSYMQMVFGYLVGYFLIATVLMPIYYKYNLTSIYGYLEKRFGFYSYKMGAAFFLLSRTIGASLRLFLVAIVLQKFVMDAMGVPFALTVAITILLIWIYTFKGGIKTIVITDTFQTVFMLGAVVLTVLYIGNALDLSISGIYSTIKASDYSQMWFFEGGWSDPNNFYKQFITGALIALVMTGLDQDMMQKNLTCRTLRDAQKNVFTFSIILVIANVLFLSLGALLYIYANSKGIAIPERTDQLYPTIALEYLPATVGIVFILGLIAATYSSADSALTALTTSFCVDFLNMEKDTSSEEVKKRKRLMVHIAFSIILFLVILVVNALNNDAIINGLFIAAGYTYGPILGLFAFGIITKLRIKDPLVIIVCIIAPIITYIIDSNSVNWFSGFKFGFLILALNGFLTFMGLWLIRKSSKQVA